MSAAEFFDSNVLIYLVSNDAAKSSAAASSLSDGGTVSIQVLDEFASVAIRKLRKSMPETRAALAGIRAVCTIVATGIENHEHGLDIAERYKYSVYDSMIVAAALQAGCSTFFTEDLQHGQKIGPLTIRNPFRA